MAPVKGEAAMARINGWSELERLRKFHPDKVTRGQKGSIKAVCSRCEEVYEDGEDKYYSQRELLRQLALLGELAHANIVGLLEVNLIEHDGGRSLRPFLVFHQSLAEPSLYELLHCGGPAGSLNLTRPSLCSCAHQLLSAVSHCHERHIMHRHISPQNIFLRRVHPHAHPPANTPFMFELKLWVRHEYACHIGHGRDQSVSLAAHDRWQYSYSSWRYTAPELLLGAPRYDCTVDAWAVGCIIAEMATGRPLFAGGSEWCQLIAIFQALGTPNEKSWPGVTTLPFYNDLFPSFRFTPLGELISTRLLGSEGLELVGRMLCPHPEARMTAQSALRHSYFDEAGSGAGKAGVVGQEGA